MGRAKESRDPRLCVQCGFKFSKLVADFGEAFEGCVLVDDGLAFTEQFVVCAAGGYVMSIPVEFVLDQPHFVDDGLGESAGTVLGDACGIDSGNCREGEGIHFCEFRCNA